MRPEQAPRCVAVSLGAAAFAMPRTASLARRHRQILFAAVVYSAHGLSHAAQEQFGRLERDLGVTDYDRVQIGLMPMEALRDRVRAARRQRIFDEATQRRRAEALRIPGEFGPSVSDLNALRKAREAMADAQRLYRLGDLEAARKAMLDAKTNASKAEADWEDRRRRDWHTFSMREAAELEQLRGGSVHEELVHEPLPGEGRTRTRREVADGFKSLWLLGALSETGKRDRDGKPQRNLVLGERRYKAGKRYRELVESAGQGLKSGLNFGGVCGGSSDGAQVALAQINEQVRAMEEAAFFTAGEPGLIALRLVVGKLAPLSAVSSTGSGQMKAKRALQKVLDAISDVLTGTRRTAEPFNR